MNSFKKSIFLMLACSCMNASAAQLESDKEKLSYSMGVFFTRGVVNQGIDIDASAYLKAVEDVLKGSKLRLTAAEIQQQLTDYEKKEQKERATNADFNKQVGVKYLAENKQKEGVTTLDSGLQYKMLKTGDGKKPTADSTVVVHYRGTLIDGTEFDSSYTRGKPVELGVGQVIKGWQEALQLMAVGSKWQIAIPSELAYGERGAGNKIGPHATLLFDIELLDIK